MDNPCSELGQYQNSEITCSGGRGIDPATEWREPHPGDCADIQVRVVTQQPKGAFQTTLNIIVMLRGWGWPVEVMTLGKAIVGVSCMDLLQNLSRTSAKHDVNRRGEGV